MSMKDLEIRYLEGLSVLYPTIAHALTEGINLQMILNLPKGPEHFLTDIYGEEGFLCMFLKMIQGQCVEKLTKFWEIL